MAVQPQTGGSIKFSTLNLSDKNLPFTGQYFTGIDIPIQALPNNGYRFHHWSDSALGTNPIRMVNLSAADTLTAIFIAINDTCSTDSLPPQFTHCPQNIILKTDSTCASALWASPTIADNCQTPPSVSSTHQSGFCFPIGTTQVIYSAVDIRGNSATCQFSVTIESQDPCITDFLPPTITNCPENIIVSTANACVNAYWEEPLISDNCKRVPSVSSTHQSGFCFPIGTSTVIYTAKDTRNNIATCRFTVTILDSTQNNSCKQFTAANTHVICGCSAATYMPYALFLDQTASNCPGILYQNENLVLKQTTPTTATLKGRLRSADWTPIDLDVRLTGGTRFATPALTQCLLNQPTTATNGWFYYTQMSGTIKMGTAAPLNMTLDNAPFQIGKGASMQWTQLNGASARIRLSNGQTGWFQVVLNEEKLLVCGIDDNTNNSCTTDSLPPTFNNCPQNISVTTNSDCKSVQWTPPTAFDNCSMPPSVSSTHSSGFCFPIGSTEVLYTATDSSHNTQTCRFRVTVTPQTLITGSDLALKLNVTPTNYTRFNTLSFALEVQNLGTIPFENIKIHFPFPNGTANGGVETASVGTWRSYCAGNVLCYEWSIPRLEVQGNATLALPLFVQNIDTPLVAIATLQTSTPADTNSLNNTALITVFPAVVNTPSKKNGLLVQPTNPITIRRIYPNPSRLSLSVDTENSDDQIAHFSVYNAFGKIVLTKQQTVSSGQQTVVIDIAELEAGVFYIVSEAKQEKSTPIKFVKF